MNNPSPKYLVVTQWLREKIESGEIGPGQRLPSEHALSHQFGISRQTVRHGIGILENEAILERRQGSGTYVRQAKAQGDARAHSIAVISTYIDDYIFPATIRGIERVLSQNGYAMQLVITHNRVENEARALAALAQQRVAGVMAEPAQSGLPNPNLPLYQKLQAAGVPVLFFNARYPHTPFPCVALDDERVGRLATEYLLAQGHRRIAGFFKSDDTQGHLRYMGYCKALMARDLLDSHNLFWYDTGDIPALFQKMQPIAERVSGCTAAVCYNDIVAEKLMAHLHRQGLSLPRDMSIVSVDNSALAERSEPPLTSINHPKEALGRTAAENMMRLLQDSTFDANLAFAPQLVVRASVATLP